MGTLVGVGGGRSSLRCTYQMKHDLSQWLCYNDSTTNIPVLIVIIIIIFIIINTIISMMK